MKMNPSFDSQDVFGIDNRDGGVVWVILFSCLLHALFLSLSFIIPKSPSHSLKSYPVSLVSLASSKINPETRSIETAIESSPALPEKTAAPAMEQAKPIVTKPIEMPKTLPLPNASVVPDVPPKSELTEPRQVEAIFPPALHDEQRAAVSPEIGLPPPVSSVPHDALVDESGHQPTASIHAIADPNGATKGQNGLSNYPYYSQAIQNKISAEWSPPLFSRVSVDKREIISVIGFIVQRNGRTNSVEVEKSSGNRFYDESALRAVYNANPLPPLPREMTEDQRVHFEFKFMPD